MAIAISATGLTSAFAQTGDEIIQKHIDAIGGTKNWNKIKSMKMVGSMNAQGMEINMTQTVVNEKGMRTDISLMGQNGFMIVTPTAGWMYMPFGGQQTKPEPMPEDQVKMQKGQLNYKNSQLADKAEITKSKLDGKDTVNDVACYKVNVTTKDGSEQSCYFDMKTYYMVRIEKKVKVKEEETEVAVNYSNFMKQSEGIVMPMTMGTPQGDITFKTIEINKPVDDKIFTPEVAK